MTHVDGPDCRVVIYDSPQHTWGYVQQLLSSAGLPPEQVEDVVHRIHFGGRAEVPMPDLDRAQALFDRLIGAGPDREHPASDGSLVVGLQVQEGSTVTTLRRGRGTAQGFVPMDLAAVEAFMGCSLDDYDPWAARRPGRLLLRVEGAPAPWWSQPWVFTLVVLPVALCLAPIIASEVSRALPRGGGPIGAVGVFGAVALAGLAVVVLYVLRLQRVGGALVHEHAIEVRKGLSRALVRWERLRGFRDTSDYVQLLRKGDRVPEPALTITTRDDRERARLLDVLIERGLRREEP